jgi:hypothetical protein
MFVKSIQAPAIDSFLFHFTDTRRRPAYCGIDIFLADTNVSPGGKGYAVVLSELDDNPGGSVTNEIVPIINQLSDRLSGHGIHPENCTFLEYYPGQDQNAEEISEIIICFRDGSAYGSPQWKHMQKSKLAELLQSPGRHLS